MPGRSVLGVTGIGGGLEVPRGSSVRLRTLSVASAAIVGLEPRLAAACSAVGHSAKTGISRLGCLPRLQGRRARCSQGCADQARAGGEGKWAQNRLFPLEADVIIEKAYKRRVFLLETLAPQAGEGLPLRDERKSVFSVSSAALTREEPRDTQ